MQEKLTYMVEGMLAVTIMASAILAVYDDYQFHALLIGAVRSYHAGDLIRQIMTNKNLAAASLRSQPIIVPLAL